MAFILFLFVTATLFIRPAEIVVDLQALPIYEWLIVSCLALSLGRIAEELRPARLRERPITLCVLGMLVAVPLSHLSHLNFYSTRVCTIEFSKPVIYYLLLVANVNTPGRLQTFLLWLLGCIVIVTSLAVMHYHDIVDLPSLTVMQDWDYDDETGERFAIARLRSTGLFGDPNDLSMVLVAGMVISAWRLFDSRSKALVLLWLAAIGLGGYALALTKSRGGLLALGTAGFALLQARYGLRRALWVVASVVPALVLMARGRQADLGGAVGEGTGQSRIQLWAEGLLLFRQAPLFGIGQNEYAEEALQVAHNSYLHCFTELGFFGGSIFLAAFLIGVGTLFRASRVEHRIKDRLIRRLRPFMLAMLSGYGVSMLSLSRSYVVPTYLILGVASSWFSLAESPQLLPDSRFDKQMLNGMAAASVIFLACVYAFVRLFVHWRG